MKYKTYQVIMSGEVVFEGTCEQVAKYLNISKRTVYSKTYSRTVGQDGILVRSKTDFVYCVDKNNKIVARGRGIDELANKLGYSYRWIQEACYGNKIVDREYRIVWEKEYVPSISN